MNFKVIFMVLFLVSVYGESDRDVIKQKIKEATEESRSLADELADMLERIEEFRNDNNGVKDVIEQKVETSKEEQLKSALNNLGKVAEEIGKVALSAESKEEIEIVNQMTKILDDVAGKISIEEEEVSEDLKSGKERDITARISIIEDNIETMIFTLGEVISKLKGFSPTQNEINLAKDIVVEHTHTALKRRKNLKRRRPKQYDEEGSGNYEDFSNDDTEDDDAEDVEDIEDVDVISKKEVDNEDDIELVEKDKGVDIGTKKNDAVEKDEREELEEKCRDATATNRVKVCVPDFESVDNITEFYSKKPSEAKHCFDVTKTVCEESSEVVSREVCVYPYHQSLEPVVAHVTQVVFEAKFKKLKISKCQTYNKKVGEEEEQCVEDFVLKEYRIPSVEEHVEDLIELNIPEPRIDCRLFKFEIPEVICRDVTTTECFFTSFLEDSHVSASVEQTFLSPEGKCSPKVLTQNQQVCTVGKTARRPRSTFRG